MGVGGPTYLIVRVHDEEGTGLLRRWQGGLKLALEGQKFQAEVSDARGTPQATEIVALELTLVQDFERCTSVAFLTQEHIALPALPSGLIPRMDCLAVETLPILRPGRCHSHLLQTVDRVQCRISWIQRLQPEKRREENRKKEMNERKNDWISE